MQNIIIALLGLAVWVIVTACRLYYLYRPFYRRLQQRREQKRPWSTYPADALLRWLDDAGFIGREAALLIALIYFPAIICGGVASLFLWGIHRIIFGLTPKHIAIPTYGPPIVALGAAAYETYLLARIFVS